MRTALLAAAVIAWAGAANAEPFDIDAYLAIEWISEIAASPDGEQVAYTLSSVDPEEDAYLSSVWMRPADGGDAVRLSGEGFETSSPKWSPDGRYLAVLSSREDDLPQVWLYDRRGGDAQVLTSLPQGVDAYEWAPDSQRMALVAEDAMPADLDEEPLPNARPWVIDRLQFKEDYVGYLDRYRAHIWVVALDDREARQVTFGDFEDSEPAWSPDGRQIAFVSNRTDEPDRNRNTDLWLVDVAAGEREPQRLTTAETAESSPSWSPDGRGIVCISTAPGVLPIYAIPQLATVDVGTGTMQTYDALAEIQVFDPVFSESGDALLAITEQQGEQNLVRVDLRTGAVRSLVEGEDVVTEFSQSANGDLFALVSRPRWPAELFRLEGTALRELGRLHGETLAGIETARVEKHRYESFDGAAMDTLVTFPPGYRKGRAYPGILYIHGGPQAQFDFRFDAEAQLLAARGYVVVMPNPRGSWGYGQEFATAIYRDWGGIDYQDVIAAMDFAIGEGWVDPERTAVYGWSYGGMMTNHVITKTDRFDAAITGASALLYVANYGHDQYQRWWEEELGLPWLAENLENWQKISPFYALDKVTTPTLIVGGEHDWNVPILNSEQLFTALKRRGIATELVVYPGEGHVLSVPSYERDLYQRYFDWLDRYVKPD